MNVLLARDIEDWRPLWAQQDYLFDGLLHGLRSLEGVNVVDYPKSWAMYSSELNSGRYNIPVDVYGRGFTLFGTLHDDDIDRDDIENKIKAGYFDLIIVHAFTPFSLLPIILEHTPPEKVSIVDPIDETHFALQYLDKFRYFKRELLGPDFRVMPISFGIPKEKIRDALPHKTKAVSDIVPNSTKKYSFDSEDSYYQEYNESLFGITMCKAGWDCMRHYEILAARSVPWFVDIERCPETTCTTLPKEDLRLVNKLINLYGEFSFSSGISRWFYEDLRGRMFNSLVTDCTTEALAKYVLDNSRL